MPASLYKQLLVHVHVHVHVCVCVQVHMHDIHLKYSN